MAEGLLRDLAGNRYIVCSAGVKPEQVVNPFAVRVMKENSIDISGQQPKGVDQFQGMDDLSFVILVCDYARNVCSSDWPELDANHRIFWSVSDPADAVGSEEEILAVYRNTRDVLKKRITGWLKDRDT